MNKRDPGEYVRNLALAALAGQAGCGTAVVLIGALFLGIFLDNLFDTEPAFTLGLLLTSVPVSLMLMVYMVIGATRRITPPNIPSTARPVREDDDDDEAQ